MKIMGKN